MDCNLVSKLPLNPWSALCWQTQLQSATQRVSELEAELAGKASSFKPLET
jgi:hypothetical protein